MAHNPTTIPADPDRLVILDSDASALTLMSLPVDTLDQILKYILPDKDVFGLKRGWAGRLRKNGSLEKAWARYDNDEITTSYTGEFDV